MTLKEEKKCQNYNVVNKITQNYDIMQPGNQEDPINIEWEAK